MFDFVAQAKYNAWKSKAGMGKEEAMKKYIELVNSLF
jgi:acyl-CoA-binding protein